MQYTIGKLTAALTVVVSVTPAVTDIAQVEQRLNAINVTLSQFARRWKLAAGGAIHVQAISPALYTALLDTADRIRRDTRKTGLIDLTPLQPAQGPDVPETAPTPSRSETLARGKPRGRGRKRGVPDRGRFGRSQSPARDATSSRGRGRGGTAAANRAGADPLVALIQQQQQLLTLVLQRTRSPKRPRTRYCRDCDEPEHHGRCAGSDVDTDADADDDDAPAPAPAKRKQRSRSRGGSSDSDSHSGDDQQHRKGAGTKR
jgi:hypothetical protein